MYVYVYIYYVTHVYISISTCKFKIYRYIHIDACRMYPLLLANYLFFLLAFSQSSSLTESICDALWETSSKLCASIPMLDSDFRGEIPHGFGNPPDFHGEKRQIILLQPCQWAPVALRIDPDHI